MLTKEGLAGRLNGCEYREEMSKLEQSEAKSAGLVVVIHAADLRALIATGATGATS